MSDTQKVPDVAETTRHARFGKLPERIPLEDTVEEQATTVPDPAKDTYNADEFVVRYGA
jgi:hypothetical protein